jgi:fluoroquinolone resistance protein
MVFKTSVINSSSFYGLELEGLSIKECEAKDVDFREANLSEATFIYTDLSEALFFNTNLLKVNFSYAQNFNIDIKNNPLEGAIFSRYEAIRLLSGLGIELID